MIFLPGGKASLPFSMYLCPGTVWTTSYVLQREKRPIVSELSDLREKVKEINLAEEKVEVAAFSAIGANSNEPVYEAIDLMDESLDNVKKKLSSLRKDVTGS